VLKVSLVQLLLWKHRRVSLKMSLMLD